MKGPASSDEVHQDADPSVPPVSGSRTYFVSIPFRPVAGDLSEQQLDQLSLNLAVYGAGVVLVGLVAILFPLLFLLTVARLIGWLLALGGAMALFQFFFMCGAPGKSSFLTLGALHLLAALFILFYPLHGAGMVILVLSLWFLVHGLLKLVMAFQLRLLATWPAAMVSGLLSVVLALISLVLAPRYGLVMLCIVFGSDLVVSGTAMLLLSYMAFFSKATTRSPAAIPTSASLRQPLVSRMSVAAASA